MACAAVAAINAAHASRFLGLINERPDMMCSTVKMRMRAERMRIPSERRTLDNVGIWRRCTGLTPRYRRVSINFRLKLAATSHRPADVEFRTGNALFAPAAHPHSKPAKAHFRSRWRMPSFPSEY